ncbi:hypothetical protein Rs2_09306 [Raphanus sativus]|nr:hypothetical protein Rs2_09306 [Raphanus sativus]
MKVFVDTMFGSTFSFDLDPRSKVFDIKKSIETSQGIPVSMQTLYFNDAELVVDHYQLRVYHFVSNSRLLLLLRDDHVNNQMLHQSPYAIQGFVPSMARSNYAQVPPSHANASFFNQDPRTMARSNQVPPSHASESFFNQDLRMMPRSNQVFRQRQISPVPPSHASASFYSHDARTTARSNHVPPSNASGAFYNQYRLVSNHDLFPEMPQDISLKQGFWHGATFGDNVKIQESLGRNKMNQDLLQREPSLPSNTFGDLSLGEDFTNIRSHWPASTTEAIANENNMFQTDHSSIFEDFSFGDYRHILTDNVQSSWLASTSDEIINKNQVFPTEHSPVQSNSTEESSSQAFQTKKSPPPQKLTITMTQYDKPGRKFLLEVNTTDNVEELKKELEYQLDLPAEGYFLLHKERVFLHKERVLDDDKSFSMNLVANGDTIEIFPGPVIEDSHT